MTDAEVEKQEVTVHDEKSVDSSPALKLDPYGYPLRPQPTDDPLG